MDYEGAGRWWKMGENIIYTWKSIFLSFFYRPQVPFLYTLFVYIYRYIHIYYTHRDCLYTDMYMLVCSSLRLYHRIADTDNPSKNHIIHVHCTHTTHVLYMYRFSTSILLFFEYSMYAAYTTYNSKEEARHDTPSPADLHVTIYYYKCIRLTNRCMRITIRISTHRFLE